MAYNVRLGNNQYRVGQRLSPQYSLDVNYEIPTKSTQYSNLRLDDISSLFNGSEDTFPLSVDGDPYYPMTSQQLLISIGNVVLDPSSDYIVSSDQIIFTNPPVAGVSVFFGVAMATTADLTRTLNYVIDSGSFVMSSGPKGNMAIDVTGTIESWTVVSENDGNIEIDIKKCSYQDFPNFVSITGTERPRLGILNQSTQRKNKDDNLSTWNTQVNAGDIFQFEVVYSVNINRCVVSLKLKL